MMAKIIPDDRSRQGPSGRPVLGVLLGALALLAVAIAGYMIWVGATSPDSPSQEASRGATTGSQTGSGGNPSNRTSPANPAYPAPAEPSATGTTNR
jgi:flagellar basal body-associated protein FliL